MIKWKSPLIWFRGLVAAFIGGGAGSVASGIMAAGLTPDQYNLHGGLRNLLVLMCGSFVVNGIITGAGYLQKSPLPELEEVNTQIITREDTHITTTETKTLK